MKALTVKQPWAGAILRLGKNIENRTWKTNHRGLLLIHAGMTWDWEGERFIRVNHLDYPGFFEECRRDMGRVIGIVNLSDITAPDGDPWAFGPFCWRLDDSVYLKYTEKTTGKLSLWEYPAQSPR